MPTLEIAELPDFLFLHSEDFIYIFTDSVPTTTDNLFLEYWIMADGSNTEEFHGYLTFESWNAVTPYGAYDGKATLRINDILDVKQFLPPADTIFPEPAAFTKGVAFFAFKQYRIDYMEWSGDPPAEQTAKLSSTPFTCIWGGLPKDKFVNDYFGGGDTVQILHPYLKWKETNAFAKPVRLNQPDYLYFWTTGEILMDWKAEATFDDGTVETFDIVNYSPIPGQVNWMTAGPRNLGILEPTTFTGDPPTLVSYKLYDDISGKGRDFVIQDDCVEEEIFLLFDNGMGGMNSVAMTGDWEMGGDVEKGEFRKIHWEDITESLEGDNNPARQGEIQSYNVKARDTLKLNTGYISKEYAIYLRQMLCGDCWFIRYQNSDENEFLKMNVQEDQITFKARGDLHYIELTLKSSYVSPNLITI